MESIPLERDSRALERGLQTPERDSQPVYPGSRTVDPGSQMVEGGPAASSIDQAIHTAGRDGVVEFVRHPRARRYLIRVRLDGSVRVTIPRRGSRREAMQFFAAQQSWIERQRSRVAALRSRLPTDLPDDLQRELRGRAAVELPARLLELAAAVGVSVRKVSVRNQRQRWGSCSRTGHICLNWRLLTMPAWVRDYVIYHELMHLKRMDHSPAFWKLVAAVCPDYESARRWLRRYEPGV
jgi:predicted metal-dependent hydrolase